MFDDPKKAQIDEESTDEKGGEATYEQDPKTSDIGDMDEPGSTTEDDN